MHKIFLRTLLYIIGATLLASCTEEKVYKIGVAQCSKGPWREKVNQEMLAAQHLYEHDVKINIANSVDDPELQAHLIDSLPGFLRQESLLSALTARPAQTILLS